MLSNQLAIELAARLPIEAHGEKSKTSNPIIMEYRFDLRSITGDFFFVEVAAPFACEESARLSLYHYLIETYSHKD